MLALISLSSLALAAEGMWLPEQLPELAPALRDLGFEGDPAALADLGAPPLAAVIWLGGCTASFVSPEGLAVTNHHCAHGSIQYNSSPERNLLRDGFLATDRAAELPAAPGTTVRVLVQTRDVTDEVLGAVPKRADGAARARAIEDAEKALVAACEQDEGHRCAVGALFGGLRYVLRKDLELQDVRLVYAPSERIGDYGGDVDNWMWPRHTGDFSFYRAYVGPDGQPAPFAEDNIPYRPPHHLPISTAGVRPDAPLFVTGYPGGTARHRRGIEVREAFTWSLPRRIDRLERMIATIERTAPEGSEAHIRYASMLSGLNNALKNYRGQLDGAERIGLLERRDRYEAALADWAGADRRRRRTHGRALAALDAELARQQAVDRLRFYHQGATQSTLLSVARMLLRLAEERQLPDAERRAGYQERDLPRLEAWLTSLERRFDPAVDQALWLEFLTDYAALPPSDRIAALDDALGLDGPFDAAAVQGRLEALYADTTLTALDTRLAWMDATPDAIAASPDPFLQLAVALATRDRAEELRGEAEIGALAPLRADAMAATLAWRDSLGQPTYPDANATLRVSYGRVTGPPDDPDGAWLTDVEGVVAKHTGAPPFDAPARLREAVAARAFGPYADPTLGSVPVAFLSDHDITGGNSGSPVLDGDGALVGLAFDGTLDGVVSTWDFDPTTARMITVDARYMLWVMDAVDGAHDLLRELGHAPALAGWDEGDAPAP